MGAGNFVGHNNITMYVTKLYNEAKYLEPPIPFKSFVRYVSKHLPRAVSYTHLDVYKRQERADGCEH